MNQNLTWYPFEPNGVPVSHPEEALWIAQDPADNRNGTGGADLAGRADGSLPEEDAEGPARRPVTDLTRLQDVSGTRLKVARDGDAEIDLFAPGISRAGNRQFPPDRFSCRGIVELRRNFHQTRPDDDSLHLTAYSPAAGKAPPMQEPKFIGRRPGQGSLRDTAHSKPLPSSRLDRNLPNFDSPPLRAAPHPILSMVRLCD